MQVLSSRDGWSDVVAVAVAYDLDHTRQTVVAYRNTNIDVLIGPRSCT
jgi:hypothetical protein